MLVSLFLKPNGQTEQRLKFQHGVHLCKTNKTKTKATHYNLLNKNKLATTQKNIHKTFSTILKHQLWQMTCLFSFCGLSTVFKTNSLILWLLFNLNPRPCIKKTVLTHSPQVSVNFFTRKSVIGKTSSNYVLTCNPCNIK